MKSYTPREYSINNRFFSLKQREHMAFNNLLWNWKYTEKAKFNSFIFPEQQSIKGAINGGCVKINWFYSNFY